MPIHESLVGNTDDFNAFIRKMQESYGYIDTHVRYMYELTSPARRTTIAAPNALSVKKKSP